MSPLTQPTLPWLTKRGVCNTAAHNPIVSPVSLSWQMPALCWCRLHKLALSSCLPGVFMFLMVCALLSLPDRDPRMEEVPDGRCYPCSTQ